MKKIFAFIIAVLYLAVSSGLVVEIHHCMGNIAGVNVLVPVSGDKQTCGKCGMEKGENKCCKDELKFVKLQDTQKPASSGYQFLLPPAVSTHSGFPDYSDYTATSLALTGPYNNGPPGYPGVSRCIMHCIFRI